MRLNSSNKAIWVETQDWHTCGEPFRIVHHTPTDYLKDGLSVADQRLNIIKTRFNLIRKTLVMEPRGHADMYGGFNQMTPMHILVFSSGIRMAFQLLVSDFLIHQSLY